MTRFFRVGLVCLCAALPASVGAQEGGALVNQLRGQGYAVISVERTWLGRTRIVVQKDDLEREIVISPINGEILRDHQKPASAGVSASGAARGKGLTGADVKRGNSGGNRGGGNSGNGKGNGG